LVRIKLSLCGLGQDGLPSVAIGLTVRFSRISSYSSQKKKENKVM